MLINWQALKKHKKETPLLIVDLIVLFLIVLNLSWLLIDSILMNTGFGILFAKYFPHLFHGYKTNYHQNSLFMMLYLPFFYCVS